MVYIITHLLIIILLHETSKRVTELLVENNKCSACDDSDDIFQNLHKNETLRFQDRTFKNSLESFYIV